MDQAIGFYEAGSRCATNVQITPSISRSPSSPMIVCYAFSLELYLKLLYFIGHGKAAHGHDLNVLFKSLKDEIKIELVHKLGSAESGVEQFLQSFAKAFVDWRYSFEHTRLYIEPRKLTHTIESCHKLVRKLRPDLRVFGENYFLETMESIPVTVSDDPEATARAWMAEMGHGPITGK